MTDLSQVPDDELLAMYAMPALIKQESGGRAGVLGPQTRYGRAEGLTQMLPATAKAMAAKVGVPWRPELMRGDTPEAAEYQERLGQAYLQEGIQKTGSLPEAFKYYHGGPDQRQWGPKTNAYAESVMGNLSGGAANDTLAAPDLSALSDEELLAMYTGADAPAPAAAATPAPAPRKGAPRLPQAPPQRQGPTIAQDVVSGAAQPWKDLGATISSQMNAPRGPPTSIGDFLKGAFIDPVTDSAALLGGVANLASTPIQAAVRPIARGINRVAPPMYEKGPSILSSEFWDDKADIPRRLDEPGRQAAIEGSINTALSAARATPRPVAAPKLKPKDLATLEAEKQAAYAKVDASGYRFPNAEVQTLADNLGQSIRDMGGPKAAKLLGPSDALQARLDALAKNPGGVPLTQLEKLRSDTFELLVKPGGPDAVIGNEIRREIDNLISASGNSDVAAARAANTRFVKVKELADRVESADLRAGSTYAGGNQANAARQNLRPLIDPKSPQRMRNLTPAEARALRKVVKGTGGANAARVAGKLLDPRGLLGAAVQTALGIPTGGQSLVAVVPGMMASELSNSLTMRSIGKAMDLMSTGGGAPKLPPKLPILQLAGKPPVKLLSPAGIVGAGTVAAPAGRLPSSSGARSPARTAPPKKRQTSR